MSGVRPQISLDGYVGGLSRFLSLAVRNRLSMIAIGTLAVMLAVFLVSQLASATYTATGGVRLARVDGAELMTPQATAAQMNQRMFVARALDASGAAADRNDRGRNLLLDSFTARPNAADSLTLVVTAASEKQARDALEAVVNQLNKEQEKRRAPVIEELNDQLALIDANIGSLTRIRETLATSDSISSSTPDDGSSLVLRRVWLLDLTTKNEERLAAARAERHDLVSRMGPTKTYPASLSDDDVSIAQSSPRPVRNAIFAGAIALLALLVYAMIRMPGSARAD